MFNNRVLNEVFSKNPLTLSNAYEVKKSLQALTQKGRNVLDALKEVEFLIKQKEQQKEERLNGTKTPR
jgi:hypothetical protein